ncbi:LANO_0A06370g1_1 [Lachancea nothofagi CBS 11611]|uniref:LANO_0A06370g1_1 n=1 Tax=Lachancea nothofagi CBS 11611 TaxID=1266666 RepID=A0A1G4IS18_9SACH|nr:LANO_0A06370g1_1 [Lachancea nothofagi CBS 11611]
MNLPTLFQHFGARIFKPTPGTLRLMTCSRILQSSYSSALRQVHSTAKKDHTTLLNSDKLATFNVLSLKALKNECRTRGLKISGRKGELVDRILAFENSGSVSGTFPAVSARKLHSLPTLKNKGSSKHVDDVKLPDVAATEDSLESLDKEYIVHITPLSESADKKPVTLLEKELLSQQSDSTSSPQVSTTDHEKVIFHADTLAENYEIVNEDAEAATETDSYENSDPSARSSQLNTKDKTFFLSFAAVVAGWWSLKYWSNSDERKD